MSSNFQHRRNILIVVKIDFNAPPTEHQRVFVDPNYAALLLAERDVMPEKGDTEEDRRMNRKVSDIHVEMLARDMAQGYWKQRHTPGVFDTQGRLRDSAHTLRAIVMSGKGQWLYFVTNETEENIAVIDTGARPRSAADQLAVTRGVMDAGRKVATANAIHAVLSGEERIKVSTSEKLRRFDQYHDAIDGIDEIFPKSDTASCPAPLRSGFSIIIDTHPILGKKFALEFKTGVGLSEGDPALVLRNWVANSNGGVRQCKNQRSKATRKVLVAFLAYKNGQKVDQLKDDKNITTYFKKPSKN